MTFKLLESIYSIFNTQKKPYAYQGEEVKIIHSDGKVAIVESKSGQRFSVKTNKLIEVKK